jgi:hypothetical protein
MAHAICLIVMDAGSRTKTSQKLYSYLSKVVLNILSILSIPPMLAELEILISSTRWTMTNIKSGLSMKTVNLLPSLKFLYKLDLIITSWQDLWDIEDGSLDLIGWTIYGLHCSIWTI